MTCVASTGAMSGAGMLPPMSARGQRPVAASLRLLGAQLGGSDGSRSERSKKAPAKLAPSLYDSCLVKDQDSPTRRRNLDAMTLTSLNLVKTSLERDQAVQNEKYNDLSPSKGNARFNVVLPSEPQHDKFSKGYRRHIFRDLEQVALQEERDIAMRYGSEMASMALGKEVGSFQDERNLKGQLSSGVSESTATPRSSRPSSASSRKTTGSMLQPSVPRSARDCSFPRYCVQTLEKWFQDIDEKGCGAITQREIMAVLRENEDLQRTFCLALGIKHPLDEDAGPQSPLLRRRTTTIFVGMSVEDQTQVRREEKKRIKEVMSKLEYNKDRMLDYQGFLTFFRKHGMLLE